MLSIGVFKLNKNIVVNNRVNKPFEILHRLLNTLNLKIEVVAFFLTNCYYIYNVLIK